jgi:hypothetical protein
MAAKQDSQIGLRATVHAEQSAVINACARSAEILGTHAEATTAGNKVTVRIKPGMVKAMSSVSPVVGMIVSSPANEGAVTVTVRIESFRTVQTKYMFFIPIGPKRLVGKSSYLNLLRSVEQELRAIDSSKAAVVSRTGAQ